MKKNLLEKLANLLIWGFGVVGIITMLFIGLAFELPTVAWISGIIGVVGFVGGLLLATYVEEVL